MSSIFKKFKYLIPTSELAGGHAQMNEGGRTWENMYRDRWSFDKTVRTTHGVNCTGSCSWNVHVKNGIVAWENQATDYPETAPDMRIIRIDAAQTIAKIHENIWSIVCNLPIV